MEQHVLLNLTTKKYVLGSSDFGWRELGKRWDSSVRSLGDAAISQICWSQDSSTSMNYTDMNTEGGWAGHRLAIVSESAFREFVGVAADWMDCSKEVHKLLKDIWDAEYC